MDLPCSFSRPTPLFHPRPPLAQLLTRCALLLMTAIAPLRAQLYTQSTTLTEPLPSNYFGYYVAISGDTLVVGTSSNKRIYVYVRGASGWTRQALINATYNGGSNGRIALDGDTLVAGEEIYVRSGSTWTLQQTLPYTDTVPALRGDTLAIGVPSTSSGQTYNPDGSVYIYQRTGTTWTLQSTLAAPAGSRESLGYSVAMDGNTVVAGTLVARAYVLARTSGTWTLQATLSPPSNGSWTEVAVEGDIAAVTTPAENRIHLYERSGTSWNLAQTLDRPTGGRDYFGAEVTLNGGVLGASSGGNYFLFTKTRDGWREAQRILGSNTIFSDLACANNGRCFAIGRPFENSTGFVEICEIASPPAPGQGWHGYDIGTVGVTGSDADNNGTISVSGGGADIWDRSDAFRFRAESLTGDGAIVARIASAGSGNPWSKIGLMFRETLAPSARYAMIWLTPFDHIGLQARPAAFDTTDYIAGGQIYGEKWLMLARSGDQFAGYWSADGENWTLLGTFTIPGAPATLFSGLAITSHDPAHLNTGVFEQVDIIPVAPSTDNWSSRDIGNVGTAGADSSANGAIDIDAGGSDIWAETDAFRYYYRSWNGDGDWHVRVTDLTGGDPWAKAGLMFRESLDANARNAFAFASRDVVTGFQARSAPGGSTSFSEGTWVTSPYWVRLVRAGNVFTAYDSANGIDWTLIGSQTVVMSADIYLGLAVTAHNAATQAHATFDQLTPATPP